MKIELVDKLIFSFACVVTILWQLTIMVNHMLVGEEFLAAFALLSSIGYGYFGSKLWWYYK